MLIISHIGFREVTDETLAHFYETGGNNGHSFIDNEFLQTSNNTFLKYQNQQLLPVHKTRIKSDYVGQINPMNNEQMFALNLLFDKSVKCLTLIGKAGCGKTFLTAQAGLAQVENDIYNKIFFTRNHVEVGKPLGALPGDILDKIRPYCASLIDQVGGWEVMHDLLDKRMLEVEAISFLQGRDLKNCFIIVDEAQNINKEQVKMLVTRVGEGSKIVFCGDLEQVAHNDYKNGNNGLEHLINKFTGITPLFGIIELQTTVRSDLSQLAAEIL